MSIHILDDFHPEDLAMMQALYSRSAASVTKHIEKVKKTGSGKFMEEFYVQYGHESIGDAGSTTIFIEGVSILAAKAIQDWPLYSGQETSTRYIDMSKQSFTDPINTPESAKILTNWMDFYLSSQEPLKVYLKEKYPLKEGENPKIYEKAIAARCFDILRAFLPAGINTQLSWHTNLRQAANKLAILVHHHDPVIAKLAKDIKTGLLEKYPHSFSHKSNPEGDDYFKKYFNMYNMVDSDNDFSDGDSGEEMTCKTDITNDRLRQFLPAIKNRPKKSPLPGYVSELGMLNFSFWLDYGSFRDLQRHRNGICRMPLLTADYGFHQWYLDQLSPELRLKAQELISSQSNLIKALDEDDRVYNNFWGQYYCALGYMVPCHITYGLPETLYVIELRSGNTVHATLRDIAFKMRDVLVNKFPEVVVYADETADEWSIRRGAQDIIEK